VAFVSNQTRQVRALLAANSLVGAAAGALWAVGCMQILNQYSAAALANGTAIVNLVSQYRPNPSSKGPGSKGCLTSAAPHEQASLSEARGTMLGLLANASQALQALPATTTTNGSLATAVTNIVR
jgi:hypothetical protein